jgi:hypothetical protein
MPQSGYGSLNYKNEFLGAEIPVANAVAYGTSAGGCNYYLGEFKVTGDLAETDTGVVSLAKTNGWIRISGNNENGKGVAVGTEVIYSPTLNGPLAIEARVEAQALTTRVFFIGFCDVNANDVAEPVTSTGTTLTLVASDLCGFILDSQLSDASDWHMVYNGGTTTGATASGDVDADDNAVAGESQVLRVEIDRNGTARWYIDGVLLQTITNAVSTTVLQAAYVGCWGTTSTAADLDIDFLAIEANRDWTV